MSKRKAVVCYRQLRRRVRRGVEDFLSELGDSHINGTDTLISEFRSTASSTSIYQTCTPTNNADILTSGIAPSSGSPTTSGIGSSCLPQNLHTEFSDSDSSNNLPRDANVNETLFTTQPDPSEKPCELNNINLLLANWTIKHNVSHSAVSDLLHILAPFHSELPLDCRTLLCTPRNIVETKLDNGSYCHVGLINGLNKLMTGYTHFTEGILELSFNIDGLPLYRSSNVQIWPILCIVTNMKSTPFTVGVFCGISKPKPLNTFLDHFVKELKGLLENGYVFNDTHYQIKISSFVCDAPAKAFIKCIKSHGGYSSCDKCCDSGEYHGRVVFLETNATRPTDKSFELQQDEDHHLTVSPLINLGIGLVSTFPIDYMHAVCLGVTRKLINIWISGPLPVRLNRHTVSEITRRLVSLKQYICVEFNRKPRTLNDVARWKATEFRTFLIYVGPLVLEGLLDISIYEHFLLLHSAITIFLSQKHLSVVGVSKADELIKIFVNHSKKIYGKEFLVYNVHVLIHLQDDVNRLGPLDNFSAFPFENYLGQLKRLVKSPINPLAQICRRLSEAGNFLGFKKPIVLQNTITHGQHTSGPVLQRVNINKQFKKVTCKGFTFCINKYVPADSYCLLHNRKLVQIENIITDSENTVLVIGKEFIDYKPYYIYPFESTTLDICIINKLSALKIWKISNIYAKCLVLPCNNPDNGFICFPLVHTLNE